MLVVVLLLSLGQGILADLAQSASSMVDVGHETMGDGRHCDMPEMADSQCYCDADNLGLGQAVPQRDSSSTGFDRTDRWVLVAHDSAELLPIRAPPREALLFSRVSPPIPDPLRFTYCCLLI